jgi:predicted RecB family nuclease
MKRENGKIILSASDLMRFQGCAHAATLDLDWLNQKALAETGKATAKAVAGPQPGDDSEGAKLLQKMGDALERAYLHERKSAGVEVLEIETKQATFAQAQQMTIAALKSGRQIIYQPALGDGAWGGYADFLERVERPSKLGEFSYELVDTKLKRSPSPSHVLQLALYADLLADIQGVLPEHIHVQLGDNTRASLRLADYIHYARRLRRNLETFIADPPATRPEPVPACTLCRWQEHCKSVWDETDSLVLVAGIRKAQRLKLESAGVTTLASLAARAAPVPDLQKDTLAKLREQATLQHQRRQGRPPSFKLRDTVEPGLGLGRMPQPNAGDLFFDMEGDPHVDGGLEYLFGVWFKAKGHGQFEAFWAHDNDAERQATRDVLDFFDAHITKNSSAYIYHYNHYEVTALKRLVSKHGVGEAKLDRLLREQRFVDLYRIVQQGIIASEPGYSIKDLEAFYAEARSEQVTSAADSIVQYEKWRETKDQRLLDDIRAYNEFDCKSTEGLRDWLVRDVRPKQMPWADLRAQIKAGKPGTEQRLAAEEAERAALRARLGNARSALQGDAAELLFELMWYHKREDKPQWWTVFDRAQRETNELIDDLDCLGGLTAISRARPEKQSQARTYRFPEQETKMRDGSNARARIEGIPSVSILHLDAEVGEVEVKFGPKAGAPPETLDLIPAGPIDNDVLRDGAARVANTLLSGHGGYPALQAVLKRALPSIKGVSAGKLVLPPATEIVAGAVDAITRMQDSYLPIQGPPGTGKTYVASRAIVALLKAGKRVAVTSNSHKAIDNLMLDVAKHSVESRLRLQAIKKADEGEALLDVGIPVTKSNDDPRIASSPLVAGTAWLFARPEHDQRFDYLFVDEAGQFSLANLVAAGGCARNIVLVGDPMQLAQPIQGMHPAGTDASALGHVLGDAATVRPERGIFLPVSRRMHPAICKYISDVVYDGRLTSDAGAARQALVLDKKCAAPFPAAGLRFQAVAHDGDSQSSAEEAEAIRATYDALLGQSFQDRDGKTRAITSNDILVVTPYNAQVNLLTRTLPTGARVGTVDKFQGQEAPVCLVSMATSSAAEMPRNIEFLFSVNRLNVAISRAQALSILFASPRLLDVPCQTIDQMRLVNALCAVAAYGVGD